MNGKINGFKSRWIQWLLCGFMAVCVCSSACRATMVQTQSSASAQNHAAQKTAPAGEARATGARIKTNIGFRTKRKLDEHYDKHGREFGSITKEDYLRQLESALGLDCQFSQEPPAKA